MKVFKAPNKPTSDLANNFYLFLAGSIEMNTAERWQDQVVDNLKDLTDIVILNPRRDAWDNTWKQTIEDKNFNEQVNWEMDYLEAADLIIYYFDPNTKAPITFFELGLFTKECQLEEKDLIVCCPEGFYRKGNVDIICKRYNIPQADTLDDLVLGIKNYFQTFNKK